MLEQHIFSDYSSFILIRNVHDEVLRSILSEVIERVVEDAACQKISNVLVDTSDLAISQYSLLGQTLPPAAPDGPAAHSGDSSSVVEDQTKPEEALVEQPHVHNTQHEANTSENPQEDPAPLYPVIVVTEELNGSSELEEHSSEETTEEVHLHTSVQTTTAEPEVRQEDIDPPEAPAHPENPRPSPAPPTGFFQKGEEPPSPDLPGSELLTENQTSDQHPSADSLVNTRLELLSQAMAAPTGFPGQLRGPTDRAVYLSGEMKDSWEVERAEKEKGKEKEEARWVEVQETSQEETKGRGGGEGKTGVSAEGGEKVDPSELGEGWIQDSPERSDAKEEEVEREAKDVVEEEEEEQEDSRGQGEEHHEVLHDRPPVDPGPGSIAAIRELVSEVIEVEETISRDPDFLHRSPASCTDITF